MRGLGGGRFGRTAGTQFDEDRDNLMRIPRDKFVRKPRSLLTSTVRAYTRSASQRITGC
jgi:hypothetical protein